MKPPVTSREDLSVMDPFVLASKADSLRAACEILFVHGDDLRWEDSTAGFFLVDVDIEEAELREAFEVDCARGELGVLELVRSFYPLLGTLGPAMAEAERLAKNQQEKSYVLGAVVSERMRADGGARMRKMAPEILARLPLFAGWVAAFIGEAALELRERQLERIGLSEDLLDTVIDALRRMPQPAAISLARLSVVEGRRSSEITAAGAEGLSDPIPGSHTVEVLRLAPWLHDLKHGQDHALSLFIANYLNAHHPGPARAFACARYGTMAEGDLDVVVPCLQLGFEVKLVCDPDDASAAKIRTLAEGIRSQVSATYARAGCARVAVVTNLTEGRLDTLREELEAEDQPFFVVGPHITGLLDVLRSVLRDMDRYAREQLGHQIRSAIERAKAVETTGDSADATELSEETSGSSTGSSATKAT
jgi:hypothetical protein